MSIRLDEAQFQPFVNPLSLMSSKSGAEENGSEAGGAADEQTGSGSPDTNGTLDLEAQQKAFQRFASGLGLGTFRAPFNMNVLPPFLAALQQNPLSIQQQLLGLTSGLSGVSPGPDDDDDAAIPTEPEDLTFRKDVKEEGPGSTEHSNSAGAPTWSYEEQFKQLYELSDDQKRKEWLDDWLSFMHRIGKPVTRIPIMAKQVLDLYELYRLVVQHGGLVEIINKKLWREITKGLNLPSSITSAAFTLRTQYQKYLYDYECEKEGLSNPADLQAAIDGNRREGRRTTAAPSFAPLGYPLPHPAANLLGKHLNGLGMRNDITDFLTDDDGLGSIAGPHNNLFAAYRAEQLAMLEVQQRQLERAQRAAVEAVTRHSLATIQPSGRESTSSMDSEASPAKRARLDTDMSAQPSAAASRELKISTRKSEAQGENSMVVSMEINGITYQGVLFALDKDKEA